MVAQRFAPLGVEVASVHTAKHPVREIEAADAVIVGGGNTFHLLKHLYDNGTLWAIRERVLGGAPYIGWSAGSNVACPTLRTTNDMPVVEPSRHDALRLVNFQINPHYTDAVLPNHGGETRAQRIAEFTRANPGVFVVGLREGSALRVVHGVTTLLGPHDAKVFCEGREPVEYAPGQLKFE
jgi:dipeptidase E